MRVMVAQLNLMIGDIQGNLEKIVCCLKKAKEGGNDVVVFPELTLCGYPPKDLVLHAHFVEEMEKALNRIAPYTEDMMVVVGLVRKNLFHGEKPLLNSAAIFQDGKVVGYYDKWLLPNYDVFDERRYFEPGLSIKTWPFKHKKVGVMICEDMWQHAGYVGDSRYPRDPVLELVAQKPDLLLNLSASPYQFGKPDIRVKVCQKAAKTLNCPVLLCCQVGGNDDLLFDGYSVYADKTGSLIQLAKGFEEDLMEIDLNAAASPCSFKYDALGDLYAALVMGVRDYFKKSHFKKAILGISGGIDSAVVACIAVEALGHEHVIGVAMPSRYSSPESLSDARLLAKNLKIELKEIPIEEPFQDYLRILEPAFEGKKPDTTEENLQARIRGMILMALSNKFGHVVLSTGNKSELATGFCTLYGDMCGGLSVIGDVAKMQVYAIAKWINREKKIIPRSTLEKPPSAELAQGQKDSDSLPEYPIIDAILEGYVESMLEPDEIAKKYKIPLEVVKEVVLKIHKAEYKRRQSAPALRVSKKAFRVGRQFPIVQGWVK